MKAIIYSTAICPYCVRAKLLLDKRNVQYEEYRVDLDQGKLREMIKLTGRQTVPQIFIDDKNIGGFDELSEYDLDGGLG